jgi:hypothetical protein
VDLEPLSIANTSQVCLIWQFRRTKISLPGTTVIISFMCYLRSSYQRWWRFQPSGIRGLVGWCLGYRLLTSRSSLFPSVSDGPARVSCLSESEKQSEVNDWWWVINWVN